MNLEMLMEQRIAEAIARGELPPPEKGRGQPLSLDPYFAAREEDRVAFSILRNSGHVPQEVDWLREMGALRTSLEVEADPEQRRRMRERLAELETAWQMRVERNQKR